MPKPKPGAFSPTAELLKTLQTASPSQAKRLRGVSVKIVAPDKMDPVGRFDFSTRQVKIRRGDVGTRSAGGFRRVLKHELGHAILERTKGVPKLADRATGDQHDIIARAGTPSGGTRTMKLGNKETAAFPGQLSNLEQAIRRRRKKLKRSRRTRR